MDSDLKNGFIEPIAALAFPAICQICNNRQAEPSDGYVCAQCLRGAHPIKPPLCYQCGLPFDGNFPEPFTCLNCHDAEWKFERARALFAARGLVREIVHRFKYDPADFFQPLIHQWLRATKPFPVHSHDWVVPIPLHPLKKRERGFNQAERMAEPISSILSKPLITNAIERVKYTETQTHLSLSKRIKNVEDAFAAKKCLLKGSVLLIDDVMTTGATASACARVLKKTGVKTVDVLTLTRQLPDYFVL